MSDRLPHTSGCLSEDDGTCDPRFIFQGHHPPPSGWLPPHARSTVLVNSLAQTEREQDIAGTRIGLSNASDNRAFCCTYSSTPTHQLEVGFYIPPTEVVRETVILALTSEYNPDEKTMGVSTQIFFPVAGESGIGGWDAQRQTEIVSDIEWAFQRLESDRKLTKMLCDKVAKNLADKHKSPIAKDHNDELMRSMNSLFKYESLAVTRGDYTLKFGEGWLQTSEIDKTKAYRHDEVLKPPPTKRCTLRSPRLDRLPDTLVNEHDVPDGTVRRFVWGDSDLWKP